MSALRQAPRIYGELGTFWSRLLHADDTPKARQLLRISGRLALTGRFDNALRRLVRPGPVDVVHHEVRFDKRQVTLRRPLQSLRVKGIAYDIAEVSDHAFEVLRRTPPEPKVDTTGTDYVDETGSPYVDERGDTYVLPDLDIDARAVASITPASWLMPMPEGILPYGLQSRCGLLLLGQDFGVSGSYLEFFREPTELFPDDLLHITRGRRTQASLFGYTMHVDDLVRPVTPVARYLRHGQGVAQLARAAATAAGFAVLERDSTVIETHEGSAGTTYLFDDHAAVTLTYTHEPLQVGRRYPAGTILGRPFSLFGPDPARPAWYRDVGIDWSGGLDLSWLGPFDDLRAPDGNVTATFSSGTCRFPLAGDSAQADRFWYRQHEAERISGVSLADFLGLDAGTPSIEVNPVDVFFQAFLRHRALVAVLPVTQPTAVRDRIIRFLQREKPTASVLIVHQPAL